MANKIKKVTTKALRDFCKPNIKNSVTSVTVKNMDGEELTFLVKTYLTLEESIRFVNDVVKDSIMPDGESLMPTGRSTATAKGLLTYYAEFDLPKDISERYELLVWAEPITNAIMQVINKDQWGHMSLDIINGIDFEKQKAIAARASELNKAVSMVRDVSEQLESMFGGVNKETMVNFISAISGLGETIHNIEPETLADAMIKSATT